MPDARPRRFAAGPGRLLRFADALTGGPFTTRARVCYSTNRQRHTPCQRLVRFNSSARARVRHPESSPLRGSTTMGASRPAAQPTPSSQSRRLRRSRLPRRARQRSFAPSIGTVRPAHDGRLATFARLRSIAAIGCAARPCGSHPSPSLSLRSGSQTCRDCRCQHSCASPVGRSLPVRLGPPLRAVVRPDSFRFTALRETLRTH